MANAAKLVVIGRLHDAGYALLGGRDDVDLVRLDEPTRDSVAAAIVDADAVAIRTFKLDRELVEKAQKLRLVSRHGVGYDNLDIAALTEKGVPVALRRVARVSIVPSQPCRGHYIVGIISALSLSQHCLLHQL